jgi:NHLM bacteriocin system ABC transporter peptidase/ATP-binding protein
MKEAMSFLVMVGTALVLPGLVVPVLTSTFIDKVMVAGLDYWLKPLLLGLVVTGLLRTALTWLESYYLLRVRTQLALASAGKFFWHVLRLPVGFYTQRSPGEISSRVGITDRVAGLLSGDLAHALLALLQVVFFGGLMFFYDVYLSLISVAVVFINLALMRWIATKTQEASQRLSIDTGKVSSAVMNGLEVMETIKSTGGESSFFAKWAGAQAKFINAEQSVARVGLVLGAMPTLLAALNAMLLLGVGAMRVIDGHMTIGMLVAFQSLSASFSGPVQTVIGLSRQILELKGDMSRLDDVMQYPQDAWHRRDDEASGPKPAQPGSSRLQGRVEMQQLSFGYNPAGDPLIRDLNLRVEPGERVAIVGPSGCGKSTVSKLVMGLYEPTGGEILFDGQRRTDYPRAVFYNSVALVDQDVTMFEGTVRDNLTMWDTTIPEQDMVRAAKDACIHDMILARPGGYDALISEGGANMSGGQRQRMEIARALATNPRVLVMDEGTSALDPATEQQIDDNLRRRGCTCLIIAHRLSTIRDADQILVLQKGVVVERGTHQELMSIDDGFYRRLIAQS